MYQTYPESIFPIKNASIKFCIFELFAAPNSSLNWRFYFFGPSFPNKYAVYTFTMYAALALVVTKQRKTITKNQKNLNSTFSTKIYNSVTKKPSESEEMWAE